MPHCFVPGCPNGTYRTKYKEGVSFHKLPKVLEKDWLVAIGRDPTEIVNYEVVCSEHFKKDELEKIGERRRVKPGVIPSIKCAKRPVTSEETIIIEGPHTSIERPKIILVKRRSNFQVTPLTPPPETEEEEESSPSHTPLVPIFHNYSLASKEPDYETMYKKMQVLDKQKLFLEQKLKNNLKTGARRKLKIQTLSQKIRAMRKRIQLNGSSMGHFMIVEEDS